MLYVVTSTLTITYEEVATIIFILPTRQQKLRDVSELPKSHSATVGGLGLDTRPFDSNACILPSPLSFLSEPRADNYHTTAPGEPSPSPEYRPSWLHWL